MSTGGGAGLDIDALRAAVAAHGRVTRVVVAQTRGSTPREAGAQMLVWADGFAGTIGGGALEFAALAEARRRLGSGRSGLESHALGPALGQCCGGAATLAYEVVDADVLSRLEALADEARARAGRTGGRPALARPLGGVGRAADAPAAIRAALAAAARARGAGAAPGPVCAPADPPWLFEPLAEAPTPLFLYGAGHVGRALARVLQDLPFALTWIDSARERFPDPAPAHARVLIAPDPADAVDLAPPQAVHVAMTCSHALDLEICHRALRRGCVRLAVIGSRTKAARFRARLRALGHDEAQVAAMACPIGDPALGKAPAQVAVAIAADLLAWRARMAEGRGMREREATA
ncbi:xanthine dehydrogenase accessory protein XdhC [Oceanicella actignis]|uniref:xanthine dehydrogenase accessory protein XdhC n=1 Tax=Oceanicella actignis TaxID=1189325 RepID=UPI0011E7CDB7|nr:xanthine dehydrogenase accessory protein XdhC [Oceanicella actignis]TYO89498.1 molybdenum cofactor sulfurylase [Oceanicella actignis]